MDGIRRYAGIDWAKDAHAVCIIDERGQVLSRFEVEHTAAGLRGLVSRLEGVEGVAIERCECQAKSVPA
jgi:transposase